MNNDKIKLDQSTYLTEWYVHPVMGTTLTSITKVCWLRNKIIDLDSPIYERLVNEIEK